MSRFSPSLASLSAVPEPAVLRAAGFAGLASFDDFADLEAAGIFSDLADVDASAPVCVST
ncbi:hypothetical protein LMG16407_02761 [Pandoraea apista]|nr:hypothetical protein LMG16407_02761 [Pandoraea apista]